MNKVIVFFFGLLQAVFYTPVVLSFALFIILIPMLFQSGLTNPLFYFLPSGQYEGADILALYGKYAFGLSLLISFAEIVSKKHFTVSIKKKAMLLCLLLLLGYGFVFIFFISKTSLGAGNVLIVLVPAFILNVFAVLLNTLLSAFINFIDRTFVNQQSNKE